MHYRAVVIKTARLPQGSMKTRENPETNSMATGFFIKMPKMYAREKTVRQPLQQTVLGKPRIHMEKNEAGINSKGIKDLNVRPEIQKLLEENMGKQRQEDKGKDFLNRTLAAQGIRPGQSECTKL